MQGNQRSERLPLTDQQRRILEFMERELAAKGYPPSVREICEAVGLASSATVHGHLTRLEEKGYIRRNPTKPRAIEILGTSDGRPSRQVAVLPVLGTVAAGLPITASGEVQDELPFPTEFLHGDASEHFFLTVKGDSMIDAGMRTGDLLLVRRQETARNGEIVVAMIEDEATVKYFFKEKGRIRLQPANPYMDPIWVDNARIVGKVVSLFRPAV